MTSDGAQEISGLLVAWSNGDEEALKDLVPRIYPDLRRIARQHLRRRPANHTLESAALVNEAYLKLFRTRGIHCEHRTHFFAICAQIIRRVLVDHARHHATAKRGGDAIQVPLEEVLLGTRAEGIEVLALDEALMALSAIDARKGRVVELRYFGGLSTQETAQILRVSTDTVERDWNMAKLWLLRELKKR
jgi:RNA polymerase sigma factor (TIGR02999 family)